MVENQGSKNLGVRARPSLIATLYYVVRHSWSWICAVTVLSGYIVVMLNRGSPWRGDLIWTIDWLPISFVLVGPLISGFVAVDTARLAVGVRGLPLSRWRPFELPVAATYGVVLVTLHLLFTAATLTVSRPAVFDAGAPLAVLVHLTMLIFFIAIGSMIGRFAPPVLGGLAAALVALCAVYLFSSPRPTVGLLYAGAATTPRIGYDYNPGWLLLQFAALCVVICAAWCIRRGPSASGVSLTLRALIGTVVAIGAVSTLAGAPGERLEANAARPDACGALGGVPWCYYPQHERVIGGYADNLLALFDAARTHGYPELVPTQVLEADQRTWPSNVGTGVFYVTPEALAGERPSLWETALRLIEPVHCPQLAGDLPPADGYWEDLAALTKTWVGLIDPEEAAWNEPMADVLDAENAQRTVQEFRTCTYEFDES